jgi:hypothetical protein
VVVQVVWGALVTLPRSQIVSRSRSEASAMPPGLLARMGVPEARDLILLLEAGTAALPDSLRNRQGRDPGRGRQLHSRPLAADV